MYNLKVIYNDNCDIIEMNNDNIRRIRWIL